MQVASSSSLFGNMISPTEMVREKPQEGFQMPNSRSEFGFRFVFFEPKCSFAALDVIAVV